MTKTTYHVYAFMDNAIDLNLHFTVNKLPHALELAAICWANVERPKYARVEIGECPAGGGHNIIYVFYQENPAPPPLGAEYLERMYAAQAARMILPYRWRIATKEVWLNLWKKDVQAYAEYDHPQDAIDAAQTLCLKEAQEVVIQVSGGWGLHVDEGQPHRIWTTSHKFVLEAEEDGSEIWTRLFAYIGAGGWYTADDDGRCQLTGRSMYYNGTIPAMFLLP